MASINRDQIRCFRQTTAAETADKLAKLMKSNKTVRNTVLDYFETEDEVLVVKLRQGIASDAVAEKIEKLDPCDDVLVLYSFE